MDNLAHTLVGAALGRAVADHRVPRAGLIGAAAANAPDWTELFIGLPADQATYLVVHRGITHALLGALTETVLLTLVIGAGVRAWNRWRRPGTAGPPWRWLAAAIGLAVLSHLFMDWQGSYGLRPFLPWSNRWYYGDWVAIVDPFFWLLPLIALAWGSERHWIPLTAVGVVGAATTFVLLWLREQVAPWTLAVYGALAVAGVLGWAWHWFGPAERRRAAALILVALGAYASAQGAVGHFVKRAVAQAAVERFGPEASWAALTVVGFPFTWESILASADTVAGHDWHLARYLRAPPVQRAVRETREGRAMADFARFLVAEVDSGGEAVWVYLGDARYARGARGGWARVRVRLDPRP